MPYKDREKQKAAQARYFQEHKERLRKKVRDRRNSWRKLIASVKEIPCADCGIEYPSYVMDLDHVKGEKLFNISSSMSKIPTLQILLDEIAKCEVVCSNCHRHRTWMRTTKLK